MFNHIFIGTNDTDASKKFYDATMGVLGHHAFPLPHGNGEQARNAGFLIEGRAGVLVPNDELDPARLLAVVLPLLGDPDRLRAMSDACRGLVPPDAASALARLVLDVAKST